MDKVNEFIKRFHVSKDIDTVFTTVACYWFAQILYRRFIRDGAVLVYSNRNNYFGAKINGRVYDISGDVTNKYDWEPWLEFDDSPKRDQIINELIML